jgi:hypothetical protein
MKAYLCPFSGCMALVPEQGKFCPRHAHLQAEKDARAAARATARWDQHHAAHPEWYAWYHTAEWRALQAVQIKKEPLCKCGARATDADHIKAPRGDRALFFDPDNLESKCKTCHMAKTRRDR